MHGLRTELRTGAGKQTSEGQEEKKNEPRRETPVAAVTIRTVTAERWLPIYLNRKWKVMWDSPLYAMNTIG